MPVQLVFLLLVSLFLAFLSTIALFCRLHINELAAEAPRYGVRCNEPSVGWRRS